MLNKAAKMFNGNYADDPYATSEIDSMHSKDKDIGASSRKASKSISKKKKHSAFDSTVKGLGVGALAGGLGGAILSPGSRIAGMSRGAVIGGLTLAAGAGMARSGSNDNIDKAKRLNNMSDKDLARNVMVDSHSKKRTREDDRHAQIMSQMYLNNRS